KDDGSEAVEFAKLAHGVAKHHRITRLMWLRDLRAADEVEAFCPDEFRNRIESLRMTRDDREAQAGMMLKQLAVHIEQQFFFARAGRSADPNWFFAGSHANHRCELCIAFYSISDLCSIELHRAGDLDTLG